jgi:isopenicillin N synthase-like dioxygenase
LADTEKVNGRLLYYYPLPKSAAASEDSWIGWHNDSGFLTALAGDLYMDPEGTIIVDEDTASPSLTSEAGLYVADRKGHVIKVKLPKDCMAIQIGECAQIATGGAVMATPHCVKGVPGLARASLVCFIDTPPSIPLSVPPGTTPESVVAIADLSTRVPPLSARWTNDMTFGDFLQKTFQRYYEWSNN